MSKRPHRVANEIRILRSEGAHLNGLPDHRLQFLVNGVAAGLLLVSWAIGGINPAKNEEVEVRVVQREAPVRSANGGQSVDAGP